MRVGKAAQAARGLDHRDLHTKADAKIGDAPLPRVPRRKHHALDAAHAEAAGQDDAVRAAKACGKGFRCQALGIHPFDFYDGIVCVARVGQRLHNREVRIVQLYIFAHQCNAYGAAQMADALAQSAPFPKLRLCGVQRNTAAHKAVQLCVMQHQRRLIQTVQCTVFDYTVRLYIAKRGQLLQNAVLQRVVAARDDHVRHQAHALQLAHGMLGGLCFVLARAF